MGNNSSHGLSYGQEINVRIQYAQGSLDIPCYFDTYEGHRTLNADGEVQRHGEYISVFLDKSKIAFIPTQEQERFEQLKRGQGFGFTIPGSNWKNTGFFHGIENDFIFGGKNGDFVRAWIDTRNSSGVLV